MNKIDHVEDCLRVQKILLRDYNIEATLGECEELWYDYSDQLAAGWIMMDMFNDDRLSKIIGDSKIKVSNR
jgi:hypothetical protein